MEKREFVAQTLSVDGLWYVIDVGMMLSVNLVEIVDIHDVVGPVELLESEYRLDIRQVQLLLSARSVDLGDKVIVMGEWADDGVSDAS